MDFSNFPYFYGEFNFPDAKSVDQICSQVFRSTIEFSRQSANCERLFDFLVRQLSSLWHHAQHRWTGNSLLTLHVQHRRVFSAMETGKSSIKKQNKNPSGLVKFLITIVVCVSDMIQFNSNSPTTQRVNKNAKWTFFHTLTIGAEFHGFIVCWGFDWYLPQLSETGKSVVFVLKSEIFKEL